MRREVQPPPDPLLVAELDPGEAEVIELARRLSPCVAIIDERRARHMASKVYGLTVRGTAGVLVEAKRRGLIPEVRALLRIMRGAGYFIADAVIEAACQAVGE
jgi:predicted nucleic acid-binding protein